MFWGAYRRAAPRSDITFLLAPAAYDAEAGRHRQMPGVGTLFAKSSAKAYSQKAQRPFDCVVRFEIILRGNTMAIMPNASIHLDTAVPADSEGQEQARLTDEARFADQNYSRHAHNLLLNQIMFRKYADPHHDWDWRQYGAKLLGSVKGCRVLDYGCGQGEEATYLAKMGAQVTAIDISPVGIGLTKARAKLNGVGDRVSAMLMRCDPTEFPSESFDVIHGFGILHHIGLQIGLVEIKRLLRPGGRGLFFEHMGNSKTIERLRPKEKDYTKGERPVTWKEVQEIRQEFSKFLARPFHIASRLRKRVQLLNRPVVKRVDHAILSALPFMRHFASGMVIYLEK
jgi:2-polyprenyl-3-methyl-5-hydroxy-6-metoxy-1,4-benzoquinol methylase